MYELPGHLHYHMQIQDIVANANAVIMEQGLENGAIDQDQILNMAILSHESQLNTLVEGQASALRRSL
jgi:hypothetical protein